MNVDDLMQEEDGARELAVSQVASEPVAAREALARALAEVANVSAKALVEADDAGDDTDEPEAKIDRALTALAHLAVPAASEALFASAEHASSLVRKRVATALFSVRTGEARAVLASLVSDEESDVRNEVADAIKRHPWPEAAGALLASARAGAPLSQQVAEALAASAATAGPGERTEAASLLLTQAGGKRDRHHHHALYALTALVKHGGAFPTVGAAAERFASHEDLRVRVAGLALQVAADVERAASFAKLLELAAKGSTDESASADVQLRNLPAPLVAAGLVEAMRGGDPIVRARAASLAVGTIFLARESSLDSLLALTKDGDDGVREAAVMALARCLPAGKPFFVDRKELIAPALSALSSDSATKVTDAVAKAQRVLGVA
jgi:hypothetical protein